MRTCAQGIPYLHVRIYAAAMNVVTHMQVACLQHYQTQALSHLSSAAGAGSAELHNACQGLPPEHASAVAAVLKVRQAMNCCSQTMGISMDYNVCCTCPSLRQSWEFERLREAAEVLRAAGTVQHNLGHVKQTLSCSTVYKAIEVLRPCKIVIRSVEIELQMAPTRMSS